jgi:signal transduction histidine kinase/CheY-like chemotaxis protein
MELGAAFHATIDLLPEPLLLVRVEGGIIAANRALARQLSRPLRAIVDHDLTELAVDPSSDVQDYLRRCARSGQLLLGVLNLRQAGGDVVRFRASGAAFRAERETAGSRAILLRLVPHGESGSAFIVLNEKIQQLNGEIARRRSIDAARRRSELALREADRRKDEFLATLAHELRNPLAPIRNALQLMALSPGDEKRTANLRAMVERQLKHMVRLIDDLMDVSRITQGRLELRRERVDLDAILQIAVETSMPLLEGKEHELHFVSSPAQVYVDADVTRLAQAFSNLLNNSAKYSPPGSQITIKTLREGDQVIVRFTDTGAGIPAEMLAKIFDMFVQIDRPGGREGLGIGLTLAKRIVELHGGTLEAFSEGDGKGSTFQVGLAEAPPAIAQLPASAVARARGSHESARVLVADDNQDAAQTLALILEIEGHDVRTAHTGLDALRLAESFRPQIALLDIGMPQMNGYQAAREIRDRPWGHSILLVAVTGWGQEQDLRMASEAGFDRHLVKPVDPQILTSLVSQARPR